MNISTLAIVALVMVGLAVGYLVGQARTDINVRVNLPQPKTVIVTHVVTRTASPPVATTTTPTTITTSTTP